MEGFYSFLTIWNLVCGSVMFLGIFTESICRLPALVRVGYAMASVGMLFQASLTMNGISHTESILWSFKDIGIGLVVMFAAYKVFIDRNVVSRRPKKNLQS